MKFRFILWIFLFFSSIAHAMNTWDKNTVYVAGDIVELNNTTYVATYWNINKQPQPNGKSWDGWVTLNIEQANDWNNSQAYQGGQIVKYQQQFYLARWWNQKANPSSDNVWLKLNINLPVSDQDKIDELTQNQIIPNLEREESLLGIDDNQNGIRDDIDLFIEFHYPELSQQKAVQQLAKSLQNSLSVDTTDIILVKKSNRDNTRAISCIYDRFNSPSQLKSPANVIQEIESITSNTKLRLTTYLAFNKALDGTTWAIPEGETCE